MEADGKRQELERGCGLISIRSRAIEPDVEAPMSGMKTAAQVQVLWVMGEHVAARECQQQRTTKASRTPPPVAL